MKTVLKILFSFFFLSILYGTVRASLAQGLGAAIEELAPHLWFQATLIDTYCAFLTIYIWIFYKEQNLGSKILWFVLIILLGTFAFTGYILRELFRLKEDEDWQVLLTRRNGAL